MIKTKPGLEPLLRRPFSIFEIVRGADGTPHGISILNKRIGTGTGQLFDVRVGDRLGCLGPLGQPWPLVEPPTTAWMVAGGVGLAPFATLTEALAAAWRDARACSMARAAVRICTTPTGSRSAAWTWCSPPRTAVAARPDSSRCRSMPRCGRRRADQPIAIYCCGPTPMMQAVAQRAADAGRDAWVSLEQVMGCGMGGCYSCVVPVKTADGTPHFLRSCTAGPVFAASTLQWEGLAHHG